MQSVKCDCQNHLLFFRKGLPRYDILSPWSIIPSTFYNSNVVFPIYWADFDKVTKQQMD